MALRWIGALVEPPIAELTRMALRKAPSGHDVGGLEVLADDLDGAHAGAPGHLGAVAVGGGDGGGAGELHAEGLGERVHRRGGAHGVAVADRGRRGGDEVDHPGIVDLALGHHLAGGPHDRARAGALAAEPAVEHRADGERDRRDVDRRRGHQQGGRRLVAADGQDDAVDRVAVEHLDEAEVGEVAVEARGRALAGLLDRVDGELHGDAAGVADAVAHALGELEVVAVAGREVGAGLGDADDRLAGLEFLAADAVVHVALEVERGHVGVAWVVEPGPRAQRPGEVFGHGFVLPRVLDKGMEPERGGWQQRSGGALVRPTQEETAVANPEPTHLTRKRASPSRRWPALAPGSPRGGRRRAGEGDRRQQEWLAAHGF